MHLVTNFPVQIKPFALFSSLGETLNLQHNFHEVLKF